MQKQHDWILNIMANPESSFIDLYDAGLNANNTSLLDEKTYLSNEKIYNNDIFKDEFGNFDYNKFHNFYENALIQYNVLANETAILHMKEESTTYGMDNLFAPKEKRRSFEQTVFYMREPNPDRVTTGLIKIGEMGERRNSADEIAQTQQVLANPREVYASGDPNWDIAIWHSAPNDAFFEDFFKTRVLATWDSDGIHTDPITGEKQEHKKGDIILNENGTYFYENLDGRDIYGKLVLNKLNILTTDGSYWNKFDFFDSDDIEQKSFGGSLLKNLFLVGSMFIPYVGPWVAGINVTNLVVGLTGTLGKMLLGSDAPPILSEMEGWSKSVNRSGAKTEYALQNTWCWENFITLIGDVAGQLKELRFLFEYAPAIFKGTKIIDHKGISKAKIDKLIEAEKNNLFTVTAKNASFTNNVKLLGILQASNSIQAAKQVENLVNSYLSLGETLAKGYMTAIVVGDTYGEAKLAGANNFEAALLTLGYAAMELKLLNTDIGKWVMPELKALNIRNKNLMKAFATTARDGRSILSLATTKEAKKAATKKWFNIGTKWAELDRISTSGMVTQGALSESVEEVSEELLADFSKACFNLVQWLQGDNATRMHAFDNMLDRYTMSFLGGAFGGGITAAATSFKDINTKPTSEQTMLEVIWYIRNNKKQELIDALNKITLGDRNLSMEQYTSVNGESYNLPSLDYENSIDAQIKKHAVMELNLLEDIMNSEGLTISDENLLDMQTLKNYRLAVLQNSPVSGLYLQNFNSLVLDIASVKKQIYDLENDKSSDSAKLDSSKEDQIKKLEERLKDLRKQYTQYTDGELATNYVGAALLSMSPFLSQSFIPETINDYVYKVGKVDYSKLDAKEKQSWKEKYDNYKATEYKDDIYNYATKFMLMGSELKSYFDEFVNNYKETNLQKQLELSQEHTDINFAVWKLLHDLAVSNLQESSGALPLDLKKLKDSKLEAKDGNYSVAEFKDGLIDYYATEDAQQTLTDVEAINPEYRSLLLLSVNLIEKLFEDKIALLSNILDIFNDMEPEEGDNPEAFLQENGFSNIETVKTKLSLYRDSKDNLSTVKLKIREIPYTNITDFIEKSLNIDVSGLITKIHTIMSENKNSETMLFGTFIKDIDSVIELVTLLRNLVQAARIDEDVISLDNPVGFNITINELSSDYDLPTIDKKTSDIITLDLESFINRLTTAKAIYLQNEGKKLTNHRDTVINKNILFYNRLKKFVLNIEDEESKLKIKSVIDASTVLQELSGSKDFNISEEKLLLLEREMLELDDALYGIKLSKNCFKGFNFYDVDATTIDRNTKSIGDRAFLTYLATRISFKRSDFISYYNVVTNPEEGIAPISALEEAIYSGIAFIHGDESLVYDMFNKALVEDFNEKVENKDKILLDLGISDSKIEETDLFISFKNTFLIEGSAGTGKTDVVARYIHKINKLINPNATIWNTHIDSDRASASKEKVFNNETTAKGKEELLEYFYSEYLAFMKASTENVNEVITYKEKFYPSNFEDGVVKLEHLDLVPDAKQTKPNVLFIDEISHFDTFLLQLLELLGFKIIALGDFDQDSMLSNYKHNDDDYTTTLTRTYFRTGIKLSESMRTNNSQIDKSIRDYYVYKDKNGIPTYYYQDELGLNGVKAVTSDRDFKESIDLLLKTLPEKEEITVIYYKENSKVKNFIETNYKDSLGKFTFKYKTGAQGLEGTYYIIDLDLDSSIPVEAIKSSYYTAISRANKGVLIKTYPFSNLGINLESHKETITLYTSSPKDIYQKFAEHRKNLYEILIKDKPRPTIQNIPVSKTSEKPLDEKILTEPLLDEDLTKPLLDENKPKSLPDPITTDEAPSGMDIFNVFLHSFNTFELGALVDENGKITLYKDAKVNHYEYRIDSLIGLLKILLDTDKIDVSKADGKKLIAQLRQIRNILFTYLDKDTIKQNLKKVFEGVEDIEFGFLSTAPNKGHNWNYINHDRNETSIFARHRDEKIIDNELGTTPLRSRKYFTATIYVNTPSGRRRMLLPLLHLPNVDTFGSVPKNKISGEINKLFNEYDGNNNPVEFNKAVAKAFENNVIGSLANIFLYNDNGYVKLDNWILARDLISYGIQINNGTSETALYLGMANEVTEDTPVSEVAKKVHKISKVYTNTSYEYDKVKRGHPFVLVSYNPKHTSDDDLIDAFNRDDKSVTLMYITPPKSNIEEYLKNLHNILNGEKYPNRTYITPVKKIGNKRTVYDILMKLKERGKLPETIIEEVKPLLEKNFSNSLELMDALNDTSQGKPMYEYLNVTLVNLYTDQHHNIIPEKLAELSKDLKGVEIYYGTEFKNKISTLIWHSELAVERDYKLYDKPFTIRAKVDSPLFMTSDKNFYKLLSYIAERLKSGADIEALTTNPLQSIDVTPYTNLNYPKEIVDDIKSGKLSNPDSINIALSEYCRNINKSGTSRLVGINAEGKVVLIETKKPISIDSSNVLSNANLIDSDGNMVSVQNNDGKYEVTIIPIPTNNTEPEKLYLQDLDKEAIYDYVRDNDSLEELDHVKTDNQFYYEFYRLEKGKNAEEFNTNKRRGLLTKLTIKTIQDKFGYNKLKDYKLENNCNIRIT